MNSRPIGVIVLVCWLSFSCAVNAGAIQQGGTIFVGTPGSVTEPVTLDQFDPGIGTLTSVSLDIYTTLFAEAETNGGGGSTQLLASIEAAFAHDGTTLGQTEVMLSDTLDNSGPPLAILYFGEDNSSVTVTDPAVISRFEGTGQVSIDLMRTLVLTQEPAIVLFFGSASIEYTVTYTFGEPNPADVNDDGIVDVSDLVAVILAWGECPAPCAEDIDENGTVDVLDLLAVILAWS